MTRPWEVTYSPIFRPAIPSTGRYSILSLANQSSSVRHRLEQRKYFVAEPFWFPPSPHFMAYSSHSSKDRAVGFLLPPRSQTLDFRKYSRPPMPVCSLPPEPVREKRAP